ncbi:MAG: hypothetical protein WCP57_10375 [Bacteroidota bacterium]
MKNEIRLAKITIIIIFIALARTVIEPIRLQYYVNSIITVSEVKPFILSSFITTLGLFIMIVFYFFGRYKFILLVGILIVISMLLIKYLYLVH